MTDTPDILILVSTTEMEALKANLARAESTIDLLESHARVQAKLLADTGRERDALRGDAPRLSVEDRFKLIALINGMQKPFLGISGDSMVRDHLAFLRRIEAWINLSTVTLAK